MTDDVRSASSIDLISSIPRWVILGMEVMSPLDGRAEIWLMTRWRDEQSYREWHRSHEYHGSHKRIPKGLKLVPGSVSVRFF